MRANCYAQPGRFGLGCTTHNSALRNATPLTSRESQLYVTGQPAAKHVVASCNAQMSRIGLASPPTNRLSGMQRLLHRVNASCTSRRSQLYDRWESPVMRRRVGSAFAPAPVQLTTGMPRRLQAASNATCRTQQTQAELRSELIWLKQAPFPSRKTLFGSQQCHLLH